MIPLASLLGLATGKVTEIQCPMVSALSPRPHNPSLPLPEELAMRTNSTTGGLLNASFGNATEVQTRLRVARFFFFSFFLGRFLASFPSLSSHPNHSLLTPSSRS